MPLIIGEKKMSIHINTNQLKTLLNRAGLLNESITVYQHTYSIYKGKGVWEDEKLLYIDACIFKYAKTTLTDEAFKVWCDYYTRKTNDSEARQLYVEILNIVDNNFSRIEKLLSLLGFSWMHKGHSGKHISISKTIDRDVYENYRDDPNALPCLMMLNNI